MNYNRSSFSESLVKTENSTIIPKVELNDKVGEQTLVWAEQYFNLKEMYEFFIKHHSHLYVDDGPIPYREFRKAFIFTINNNLIKK